MARHKKHFVGSTFWIIFWIIFFFPIAIIYWAVRQEELSEKELKKLEERPWIKKHKIFSGIMAFFLLLIGMSLLANITNSDSTNNLEKGELIDIDSTNFFPQDAEIDREWRLKDIEALTIDSNGFIEGDELQVSKTESFSGTTVIMKVLRFDSIDNANSFYAQEKTKIDIRGVEEWGIGTDCFGIEKDITLSGYAEGFCVRNNIVLYVKSASGSYSYASDGKKFMKIMLGKL